MGKKGNWFSTVKKALSPDSKVTKDQKLCKTQLNFFCDFSYNFTIFCCCRNQVNQRRNGLGSKNCRLPTLPQKIRHRLFLHRKMLNYLILKTKTITIMFLKLQLPWLVRNPVLLFRHQLLGLKFPWLLVMLVNQRMKWRQSRFKQLFVDTWYVL